ncbi:MAG: ORF6N domain-containing protein [Minisyncoccia bacterium]|jgi:hypothetical protein
MPEEKEGIIPEEIVRSRIYFIRGRKVMFDRDLAELYAVKPIALRQQVKRNKDRFPDDFVFRLSRKEADILVSQNVIPSARNLGGFLPYVFTEQGIAMLSLVLKSKRAIAVSIVIVRTFVRLREMLASHALLLRRLDELEKEQKEQGLQIGAVFEAIRKLTFSEDAKSPKRKMGF